MKFENIINLKNQLLAWNKDVNCIDMAGCKKCPFDKNKICERLQEVCKEIENEANREKLRELKYPAIYKHFKGKYYATMGTSKPITYNALKNICNIRFNNVNPINKVKLTALHTENNLYMEIFEFNEGEFYHLVDDSKDKLVLYKSLYDDKGSYARELDMFLSEVDKEKYPDVKQKYRFEEVNGGNE